MRRILFAAATVVVVLGIASVATAASGQSLNCFVQPPATCTLNTNNSGAVIDTSAGGYAGVYLADKHGLTTVANQPVSRTDFAFGYYCGTNTLDTTSCVQGGAPSYRIPISTDNKPNTTELYAVIDAANCGYTGTVSTNAANCAVYFLGGTGAGGATSYPNWDAMAAANPTWVVSKDIPFVIVDVQTTPVTLYGVSASKS